MLLPRDDEPDEEDDPALEPLPLLEPPPPLYAGWLLPLDPPVLLPRLYPRPFTTRPPEFGFTFVTTMGLGV